MDPPDRSIGNVIFFDRRLWGDVRVRTSRRSDSVFANRRTASLEVVVSMWGEELECMCARGWMGGCVFIVLEQPFDCSRHVVIFSLESIETHIEALLYMRLRFPCMAFFPVPKVHTSVRVKFRELFIFIRDVIFSTWENFPRH